MAEYPPLPPGCKFGVGCTKKLPRHMARLNRHARFFDPELGYATRGLAANPIYDTNSAATSLFFIATTNSAAPTRFSADPPS